MWGPYFSTATYSAADFSYCQITCGVEFVQVGALCCNVRLLWSQGSNIVEPEVIWSGGAKSAPRCERGLATWTCTQVEASARTAVITSRRKMYSSPPREDIRGGTYYYVRSDQSVDWSRLQVSAPTCSFIIGGLAPSCNLEWTARNSAHTSHSAHTPGSFLLEHTHTHTQRHTHRPPAFPWSAWLPRHSQLGSSSPPGTGGSSCPRGWPGL